MPLDRDAGSGGAKKSGIRLTAPRQDAKIREDT